MWNDSIGSRVKKVIAQRVVTAQKEHNDMCGKLDQNCAEEVEAAEFRRDTSKEAHATKMVESIIGKIN